jgi:hypothetical protein
VTQPRVTQSLMSLGDEPDLIVLDNEGGHQTIVLGTAVAINLCGADQATLDKLATITAKAAANHRASMLREVA